MDDDFTKAIQPQLWSDEDLLDAQKPEEIEQEEQTPALQLYLPGFEPQESE